MARATVPLNFYAFPEPATIPLEKKLDLVEVGNSYVEQVVQLDLDGADLPVRDVLLELERMEVKYLD